MSFKSTRSWWRVMGLCLTLAAFAPALAKTDAERDLAAIAEFEKGIPNSTPVLIDFTDPIQEAAAYAMMRQSGDTREKSPELYAQIEQYKQKQMQRKARGERLDGQPADAPIIYFNILEFVTDAINSSTLNNVNSRFVISAPVDGTKRADVNGSVTVMRADTGEVLSKYSINTKDPTANPVDTKWIDGITTSTKPKNVGNNPTRVPVVVSGSMQFMMGGQYLGRVAAKHSFTFTPNNVKATYSAPWPVNNKQDDYALLCINRANPIPGQPPQTQVCDYEPTTLNKNKSNDNAIMVVPVAGAFDAGNDPFQYKTPGTIGQGGAELLPGDSAIVTIFPKDTGGACVIAAGTPNEQTAGTAAFMKKAWFSNNGRNLDWRSLGDDSLSFGHLCYKNGEFYDILTVFNITQKSNNTFTYTFYSDGNGSVDNYSTKVPYLEVQYGCILEGTPVRMADGSNRPIENVKEGDLVYSKNGARLKVSGRTTGTDNKFVVLQAAGRHPVVMTPDHPVPTQRGMLMASQVRKGDVLESASGQVVIESAVTETRAKSNVYNLVLVQEDGTALANPDDATFFAGELLVGDNAVQGRLSKAAREKRN